MSLRACITAWNKFFFAPQSPTPIALYRICFGVLVMANLILLWPDWLTWFGNKGVLPIETARQLQPGTRINLFALLPAGDAWVLAFFWVLLLFAFFLAVGFFTRISSVLVFLGVVSLHHRNPYILHSGDTLLRVTGFFLMFAPAGAAISIDRLWRVFRGREGPEPALHSPWAQRLIQIQAAFAYFSTFYWKSQGSMWIDGTALYYVLRTNEFRRFPLPSFEDLRVIKLATWFTLATEFSSGVLIWFREIRYYVLAVAGLLHLFIEYSMNIPLFQWAMIATYFTFIESDDLRRAWQWFRRRITGRSAGPVQLFYDGHSRACVRFAHLLSALDIFKQLTLIDFRSVLADVATPRPPKQIMVRDQVDCHLGFDALRRVSPKIPLLWALAPFFYVPGLTRAGRSIYTWLLQQSN